MLAAVGLARVPVVRRPEVAVIATGDEIVEPGGRSAAARSATRTARPSRPWPSGPAPRRATSASPATERLAGREARPRQERRHPRPLRRRLGRRPRPRQGRAPGGRGPARLLEGPDQAGEARLLRPPRPSARLRAARQSDERHGHLPSLRRARPRPDARPGRARTRRPRPRSSPKRSPSSPAGPSSCAASSSPAGPSSRSRPTTTRGAASSGPWSGAASSSSSRPTSRVSKRAGRSRSSSWTDDKPMAKLSHVDREGKARMVDIGAKAVTRREAAASSFIKLGPATLRLVRANRIAKGDVLNTARLAGIQAAKTDLRAHPPGPSHPPRERRRRPRGPEDGHPRPLPRRRRGQDRRGDGGPDRSGRRRPDDLRHGQGRGARGRDRPPAPRFQERRERAGSSGDAHDRGRSAAGGPDRLRQHEPQKGPAQDARSPRPSSSSARASPATPTRASPTGRCRSS